MKNSVTLIGHVGEAPVIRTTEGGKKVANFSLATNEKWTDDQNVKHDRTQWHRCVVWGRPAEIIEQYVLKGDKLGIDGRIEYREFTDKENVKRYATDIVVSEFYFLQPKKNP